MKNNVRRGRRLTHGTVAVVLSVLLVACILFINVIFTSLSRKYNIYTDMTDELMFTLSEEFKTAMSDVAAPVRIRFCHEPDYLEANTLTKYVYETALQIAEAFEWASVDATNANKEPTLFSKYKLTSAGSSLSTSSVIIESGDEFRILSANAFYYANSDGTIWAFNGEEKFAAAILSVTASDLPVAYFTQNHGEKKSEALEELVRSAGYDVRYIDLSKDAPDADARLIVINDPKYDFSAKDPEKGAVSELEAVDRFLASDYGSLMVFLDPLSVGGLSNLREYLYQWGIVVEDSVVRDKQNSVSTDGYSVVGVYNRENVLGASLVADIAGTDSPPKTIFEYAAPITFSDLYSPELSADNGQTTPTPTGAYSYYGSNASRDISAVLRSGEDALAMRDGNPVDASGSYNLMVVSRESRIINNETFSSYVLCTATADFTNDEYVKSNVYANKDILYAAFKQMGRDFIPADLPLKVLPSYDGIEDMTTAQANRWTAALILVLPVVTLAVGAAVVVRRKFK